MRVLMKQVWLTQKLFRTEFSPNHFTYKALVVRFLLGNSTTEATQIDLIVFVIDFLILLQAFNDFCMIFRKNKTFTLNLFYKAQPLPSLLKTVTISL